MAETTDTPLADSTSSVPDLKAKKVCGTCFELSIDAVKAAYICGGKTVSLLAREFVYCVTIDQESLRRAVKTGCQKCALIQDVAVFFNANLSQGIKRRQVIVRFPIDYGTLELTIRDYHGRDINLQLMSGTTSNSIYY
jgi:hypothetical protein